MCYICIIPGQLRFYILQQGTDSYYFRVYLKRVGRTWVAKLTCTPQFLGRREPNLPESLAFCIALKRRTAPNFSI